MSHGLALDHAAWSSPWRARSLRDKGVLCLGLLLAAICLPPVPGGAAVAVISLALLLGPIRVGWTRLLRIGWLPLVSILIGVATVAVSVSWADGLRLEVTDAGTAAAVQLAVRALAATLAMFTLACSTPMIDLLAGLRRLRVPDPLIEIAALIYRFSAGLLDSASAIHAAQDARLGFVNRTATMRSASMGVAALFLRSWDRARRLEDGLAGRGYTDALRTLEPARRRSSGFLAGSVLLLVAVTATALSWPVTR
ncbi:cobalt/nickel transport system permease protein [Propionicimonas paludicola]|uniref:Cobalt/nickel transport system permease protein n=1 Tax=Propionicimonas paludicola TaxID=185243 RepID=A0A2A9CTU7_9ACTN|nr:cobalt ECF transporter T component CbiQ [Propionicimonas paludicola]PFG17887.1 cobalt/nickel transport system permease protein [Propionicimonas paludicola]